MKIFIYFFTIIELTNFIESAYILGWVVPNSNIEKIIDNNQPFNMKNIMLIKTSQEKSSSNKNVKINVLEEEKLACKTKNDCLSVDHEMYCDSHYGYCRVAGLEGELCRIDENCAHSMICMFGKCSEPKDLGKEGSRCNNDSDCEENHCCARQLGEKVCKPSLLKGQKCFVPYGGLDYILNESCPCSSGLKCQLAEHDFNLLDKITSKTKTDHLRCS